MLKFEFGNISHRIHGTGIFTYIWLIFVVNVGKYTIYGSYGYRNINSELCERLGHFCGEAVGFQVFAI